MKQALALVVGLMITASPALAWDKIFSCNNGQANLDFQDMGYHGRFFQLVIRDRNIVRFFHEKGAFQNSRFNDSGELVIPLKKISSENPDLVGSEDAYQSSGKVVYVKRVNSGLLVESFQNHPIFRWFIRDSRENRGLVFP